MAHPSTPQELQPLLEFATCDVADALVALGRLDCHVPGLRPLLPPPATGKLVGYAFPVEFVSVSAAPPADGAATAPKPPAGHYIDHAQLGAGDVVVIATPPGAIHAVWGGLVGTRAKVRGIAGAIVDGRIRDTAELRELGLPLWHTGTSVLGWVLGGVDPI